MLDWIPHGEFAAAFFGALAAFFLESIRRRVADRRKNFGAGNEAIIILAQMYSVLSNYYQQGFLDRAQFVRDRLSRDPIYVEYRPMTLAWNQNLTLPMSRLGFLLETHDPDLLNRMSLVERSFLTILATNAERNVVHLKFQEGMRQLLGRDEPIPGHVVEDHVGMDLTLQLQQLTEHLQSDVPRIRDNLLEVSTQLRGVLDLQFPTARTLQFTPSASQIAGVQPPPSTRKAAWWRRWLRAAVNKRRRPKTT